MCSAMSIKPRGRQPSETSTPSGRPGDATHRINAASSIGHRVAVVLTRTSCPVTPESKPQRGCTQVNLGISGGKMRSGQFVFFQERKDQAGRLLRPELESPISVPGGSVQVKIARTRTVLLRGGRE